MRQAASWLTALLAVAACNQRDKPLTDAGDGVEQSPNASILPAPLASAPEALPRSRPEEGPVGIPADSAGRLIIADAAVPPPRALREDEAMPRDSLTSKDGTGVTLGAHWKWFDVAGAPAGVPVVAEAVKRAREKTSLQVSIDLAAAGRMRFEFASVAFPLPLHAELRARNDRYGHVLVWPDASSYRILTPGALRAMFGERRADVTALVAAKVKRAGGATLLGLATTRNELSTATGQLLLEQAAITGIGSSGELLCRLLVELIAAEPSTSVCSQSLTPLRAEYRWTGGGRLGFEVGAITRRQDLPIGHIFVPPAGALFKRGELPPQASGVFLTRADLTELRSRAVSGSAPPLENAPGEGFTAVNRTDALSYVLLDGVAVGWIRPHAEQYIIGPKAGQYMLGWRDFFGVEVEQARSIELPGRVVLGSEADAGTPRK